MIIQCQIAEVPVTIQIIVQTASPIWNYDYKDRGTHYKGDSSAHSQNTHALGFPHELDSKTDTWAFAIANQTAEPMSYVAKIVWLQAALQIAVWENEGFVPANDAAFPHGTGIILE